MFCPFVQATDATKVLQRVLKEADTDRNGLIDLQEFQSYFQKMAVYQQSEAQTQRLRSSRKNMPSGEHRSSSIDLIAEKNQSWVYQKLSS